MAHWWHWMCYYMRVPTCYAIALSTQEILANLSQKQSRKKLNQPKYLLRVRKCQMWESVRNRRCSCSKYRENCSQLYFDRQFIVIIIIIHKFQWGTLTIATSSTDEWCKNRHSFADLEHFPRVKSLQICWSFIKKLVSWQSKMLYADQITVIR